MKNIIPVKCPKCGERHNWKRVDDKVTTLGMASVAMILLRPIAHALKLKKQGYLCNECGYYEEY